MPSGFISLSLDMFDFLRTVAVKSSTSRRCRWVIGRCGRLGLQREDALRFCGRRCG